MWIALKHEMALLCEDGQGDDLIIYPAIHSISGCSISYLLEKVPIQEMIFISCLLITEMYCEDYKYSLDNS